MFFRKAAPQTEGRRHAHHIIKTGPGGDWNCVPDVTLDVQSENPLNYSNAGAEILAQHMQRAELVDIHREFLGVKRCPTRKEGNTATRLDRWYVPVDGAHEDTLWSVQVRDDLVWSERPTDHSLVLLTLEKGEGARGHHRRTVRENLIFKLEVQDMIRDKVEEAASQRKKDEARARATRAALIVINKVIATRGTNDKVSRNRTELMRTLKHLEHPELELQGRSPTTVDK